MQKKIMLFTLSLMMGIQMVTPPSAKSMGSSAMILSVLAAAGGVGTAIQLAAGNDDDDTQASKADKKDEKAEAKKDEKAEAKKDEKAEAKKEEKKEEKKEAKAEKKDEDDKKSSSGNNGSSNNSQSSSSNGANQSGMSCSESEENSEFDNMMENALDALTGGNS